MIDLTQPITRLPNLRFKPDIAPSPQLQSKIFEAISKAKPSERIIDWENVIDISEVSYWQITTS